MVCEVMFEFAGTIMKVPETGSAALYAGVTTGTSSAIACLRRGDGAASSAVEGHGG